MGRSQSKWLSSLKGNVSPGIPLAVILISAIAFGGGGRGAPLANLIVQIVAVAVMVFNRQLIIDGWRKSSLLARIALISALLLPILHLVPLPPGVWHNLPGRDLVRTSLQLIGEDGRWMPLSVVPSLTALAITGLVAPYILFFVSTASARHRADAILLLVVGLALVIVLLGAVQISSGGTIAAFYHSREPDYLLGTFANHNSTGLFLLIGLCCLIELATRERWSDFPLVPTIGSGLFLVLAVVLTMSRSSIFLLIVPLTLLAFRWANRGFRWPAKKILLGGSAIALFMAIAGIVAVSGNDRVNSAFARFSTFEDTRINLWEDSLAAAERYMPFGSGVGTFDEVIQIDESLETMQPQRAGRAHNDYLELLVEGGAFTVSVLFIWLAYIAIRLIGARAGESVSRPFIVAVVILYGAQSVLDYPLRSQALLCLAALMVALLEAGRKIPDKEPENAT